MKKTILSAFLVLALIVNSFAADKNNDDKKETAASYAAHTNFKSKFKNAKNVVWSSLDDYYKAAFLINGVKKAAFFNAQGEYVATTQYVTANDLPAKSLEKLKKQYKDYTIGEVLKFELDSPADAYYSTAAGSDDDAYYFASLRKPNSQIVVKISLQNNVSYFTKL